MGTIIKTTVLPNNKIKVKIVMDMDEVRSLKGHMRNIRMFTEEFSKTPARVLQRGRDGSTKYLDIPKILKTKTWKKMPNLRCQIIDLDYKTFFIYMHDKMIPELEDI